MERKAQQGMEEFKMKAKEMDQQGNEEFLEFLRQCANQNCLNIGFAMQILPNPACLKQRERCRLLLQIETEDPGR